MDHGVGTDKTDEIFTMTVLDCYYISPLSSCLV